ncbi:MAG: DNA mismatch repair endonuclease MutL [Clostridia bacterium]|nr:DNA mismatch repair endonuclease MutL [Clostridia bacterium]
MSKINILDFQVANLIAAGEVVDRPASVVKELLENAIDAGATEIEIEIKRGGSSLIRVTDNGSGMSKEDAELCILRHATSKIKTERDLDGIVTLGFRGEALAAISSVSQMKILSKRKEDKEGTSILCDCGRITSVSSVPMKKGTTVVVEELFANVPARRKFLKRDQSEGMAVSAVVEKVALSHPEISFKMISDGAIRLQTAGDKKLYNTIYALLGREFASRLIEVRGKSEAVEVFGYVGRPDNVRANRNYQNFFINGRYVKSRTATAALEQAFSSFMESERFPCCVLNVVIHPALVDVNVHPTKLEVKFSSEKTVFDAIYLAVRNALLQDTTRPALQLGKKDVDHRAIGTYNRFTPVYDRLDSPPEGGQQDLFSKPTAEKREEPLPKKEANIVPPTPFDDLPFVFEDVAKAYEKQLGEQKTSFAPLSEGKTGKNTSAPVVTVPQKKNEGQGPPVREQMPVKEQGVPTFEMPVLPDLTLPTLDPLSEKKSEEAAEQIDVDERAAKPKAPLSIQEKELGSEIENAPIKEAQIDRPFTMLGIAFDTYILVEQGDTLLMIDKHAAHERLIFEEMKKNRSKAEKYSQLLLVPISIEISDMELSTVIDYGEELKSTGFAFDVEGRRILISGFPGGLEQDQAETLFMTMVTRLSDGEGNAALTREIAFEKALYTASCKAAMKGGRKDGREHLEYLCRCLLRLPDIRYCPHGRPVAFEISKSSIEHRFGRS